MILTNIEKKEYDRYFSYYDFSKDFTNKTFLITGAKGLLGQGIIKWLLYLNEKSNTNISIIASTRNKNIIPEYIEKKDNIEYCEFKNELAFCKNIKIDYIIHCATPTDRDAYINTPYETLNVIIDGTKQMIEILKDLSKNNNMAKMIYVSSEEAYGIVNSSTAIKENHVGPVDSLNNRSCYSLGKKAAELMCVTSSREYNLNINIVRPTVIFGLLQKYEWDRIENEVLKCILENRNLNMKTKGLTKKSVVYSLDAVSAILFVLIKGENNNVYNITNPSTYDTVSNNADKMFSLYNKNCKIVYEQNESNSGYLEKREMLLDINKIKSLGWEPKTELNEIYRIDIERFRVKN